LHFPTASLENLFFDLIWQIPAEKERLLEALKSPEKTGINKDV
jgi:hypothetical protein